MIQAVGPCVVLSPHLDDAVLSVWHVLSSEEDVTVVTVFAGIPPDGTLTTLDRMHGASDSAALMRKRRADDLAALAHLARKPIHADLLDVQYRADDVDALRDAVERDPTTFVPLVARDESLRMDAAEVRRELEPLVAEASLVYTPAGIGGHPDHCDVARFGLELVEEGRPVRIYGDFPYLLQRGQPSWFRSGGDPEADAYVDSTLDSWPGGASRFDRHVFELSPASARQKIAAARLYETEFARGNAEFGGVLEDLESMRSEVCWTPRV